MFFDRSHFYYARYSRILSCFSKIICGFVSWRAGAILKRHFVSEGSLFWFSSPLFFSRSQLNSILPRLLSQASRRRVIRNSYEVLLSNVVLTIRKGKKMKVGNWLPPHKRTAGPAGLAEPVSKFSRFIRLLHHIIILDLSCITGNDLLLAGPPIDFG